MRLAPHGNRPWSSIPLFSHLTSGLDSPRDRALNTFMADISAGWPQVTSEPMYSPWTFARCDSPRLESALCPELWESSTPRALVWKVQNRQVITRSDLQKKLGWRQQNFCHPQAQVLWCSTTSKKFFRCTLIRVDHHLSTDGCLAGHLFSSGLLLASRQRNGYGIKAERGRRRMSWDTGQKRCWQQGRAVSARGSCKAQPGQQSVCCPPFSRGSEQDVESWG